jgi:hypothetical protein
LFGRLEGSRITKRGFLACFSDKHKKSKKFLLAASTGLRPNLPADKNFFPPFFVFFSSYVGYVPASNDLGIFGIDWRCEFLPKVLFLTEKKIHFL